MRVIVTAAEKGGVAKTMLTATLAVLATLTGRGARVALLDYDPQGSLTKWWNDREAEWPQLFTLSGSLRDTVNAIEAQGVEYLFIDTTPAYSEFRSEAVKVADLVLVATGAGVLDRAGIEPVVRLAEQHRVPCRTVLAKATFRTRATGEAVDDLRDRGEFLEPPIHDRQAVLRAMNTGRAVVETEPDCPGAREVKALWHSILALLAVLPQSRRRQRSAGLRRVA